MSMPIYFILFYCLGWSIIFDLQLINLMLLLSFQRLEPYSVRTRTNGHSELKSASTGNLSVQNENTVKVGSGRLSASHNSDVVEKETKPSGRLLVPANSNQANKDSRVSPSMSTVTLSSVSLLAIMCSKMLLFKCSEIWCWLVSLLVLFSIRSWWYSRDPSADQSEHQSKEHASIYSSSSEKKFLKSPINAKCFYKQ